MRRMVPPSAGRMTGAARVWCVLGLVVVGGLVLGESRAEAQAASGPLRVHATNPRYFADATGKVVYLTGSHHWENLQDVGDSNPPPAFDYTNFLDVLQSLHHNFFRLWRWEQARWGAWNELDELRYGPHPYLRTGPGTAVDGLPKFDLSQFNQAYFDRMRQRIQQAGARGMYVSVMLFDGWSIESKGLHGLNPWRAHPFNAANNINGINGDPNNDGEGLETHALSVSAVTTLQEAYIRKVVDTVNDLDNVLYEVSNESSWQSTAWQYHVIQYAKTYESTKPKQHPVGMTAQWPWPNGNRDQANAVLDNSPADWISPAGEPFNRRPVSGSKVVLADTDHLCGICGDRTFVWRSFVNGENPLFMDVWSCDAWWYPNDCNRPEWPSLRQNLGYTNDYAKRIDLARMVPRPDLASSLNALANATSSGAEYLVYLPTGGAVTVDLSAAVGSLSVEWFNPATGQASAGAAVSGGATRTFSAPFGGDAVLYIFGAGGAPTPTIGSVSPSSGPSSGGQSVTLTGTNLSGATSVTFGGVAATITGNTATSITVTTPARAAGVVSVVAGVAAGSATAASAYTYVSAPVITGLSPTSGPIAGGQTVVISGTGLSGVASVTFGSAAATIIGSTATSVTVTTPSRPAGVATVTLTALGGSATSPSPYTYLALPTVTGVSPAAGPTAGGQSVTIQGTNLSGTTAVSFDGLPATVTGSTATSATVITPARTGGVVNVAVTAGGGTATGSGVYTYVAPPTVIGINPPSGPTTGGQEVIISGTNLGGTTSVAFGGVAATIVDAAASSLTVTTPARAAGAVSVVVTAVGGSVTSASGYTFFASPTVSSVSPASGPAAGGQSVVISGANLSGATSVTIGGVSAAITANTTSSVTVTTPAGAVGAASVTVTTTGGATTAPGAYTFLAPPTLTGATPSTGPTTGGTIVTLSGTSLAGATGVTFGGTVATISGSTATSVTVTTPARAAGSVSVAVTAPAGSVTLPAAFTYLAAPTITSVTPSTGSTAGGQSVTLSGTGLSGATAVTLGGSAASITANTASAITITTPAHASGAVNVVVSTPAGTVTATNGYTYGSGPSVSSLSPSTGPTSGGQTVTASGANLTGVTAVTFGGTAATIVGSTASTVTVTTPARAAGAASVVVTTPNGSATSPSSYTYLAAPTAAGVSPASGATTGGQSVVITGTNLSGATSVTFGGTAAAIVSNSATSLTVTTPPRAAGVVSVVVTTSGGTATAANVFTYVAAPTVSGVSPAQGPSAGGQTVTISGANLAGTSAVTFDGRAATITSVTPTDVVVTTPPGANGGPVDVVVVTPGGTALSRNAYNYQSGAPRRPTGVRVTPGE